MSIQDRQPSQADANGDRCKEGVVIWHVGRCGSSVLGHCLNQHPDLQWENEIFNCWMPQRRGEKPVPPIAEAIATVKRNQNLSFQAVEVKFLPEQHPGIFRMSALEMADVLADHGYQKAILLERRNSLRRMISHCMALETRCFHLSASEPAPLPHPISIDLSAILVGTETRSLLGWLQHIEDAYLRHREGLKTRHGLLHLCYEDHVQDDPRIAFQKVCTYLGVKTMGVNVGLRRTNPFQLSDIVTNYADLEAMLKNSSFSWMLEAQ
jgi:hypothetical protein